MAPASFAPTILITGATGLLGGALAADLLQAAEWGQVLLLVRGEDQTHAVQRVIRSLARFVSVPEVLGRLRPEQVLNGDLTQPGAFIGDPRLAGITRVVNCAAQTSFGSDARAFSTNVDGTLRFVHHLRQVARIERFLHLSTAMICGDRPASFVREDDYPRQTASHLINYTASKAEAERLLRLTLPGFPLTIVRPSIIAGHTELGTGPSTSIFWAFRMADALGMITGQPGGKIDVIPVDYAARALRFLLLKPALKYPSYHISAGPESACTWDEIAEAFERAASWTRPTIAYRSATAISYRTATMEEIELRKPEFDALFGRCNKEFMMKAIRLYGAFAGLGAVFDASRLREEGFGPSPKFSDYIGVCLDTSAAYTVADQMMIDFG